MNRKKSVSAHPRQQQITRQSKSPSSPKPSKPSSTQPAPDDREGWKAYWEERQQPWRTEREIDQKRQNKLDAQRRFLVPDTKKGEYPFKGTKLSRADIEWLLATHENGRGPVDWSDERQHGRKGLDLRGTDLSSIDLKELPLAGMIGGLDRSEWQMASAEQCEAAAAQLQRADLCSASLEGASLHYIHLEKADLRFAHLAQSDLTKAHLQEADLNSASFEGADLTFAHLERAYLGSANLKKVFLKEAHLEGVDLYKAHLEGSVLCSAFFDNATQLNEVTLSGASAK